jgi:hypothetical protein
MDQQYERIYRISMSFDEYVKMPTNFGRRQTTGPVQSDEMFQFARQSSTNEPFGKTLELD